jgi:23S rRNA pseudouridine1911/1915/1917 synthase
LSLVRIRLKTGRFHQIRAQFSSRGMPLVGDGKYGSRDKGARFPALASHRLDFELMGKRVFATRMPNITEYPWRIFADEINSLGGIYD